MNKFDEIRPYQDDEVQPAVKRLLDDSEFIAAICAFRFKGYPGCFKKLLRPLVKLKLRQEIGSADTVYDIQQAIEKYLDQVIESTTTQLSFSGLEQLKPEQPYLFISNHRDIVMDPAFVNYALYHNGFETVRIAIGDNLLQRPFVSELMRLNKSFIVRRSASGVREKLQAYMELSGYINLSVSENAPIWIAQREGRAKDGIDQTDPAIIKMLYMCQKKDGMSFTDYMNWLHIVPVTIAYEYNPCDLMIAHELNIKARTGEYTKTPGEDMTSIVTGITGQKGHTHVAFGKQLEGTFNTPEEVAAEIDEQMKENYLLHPSNYIAASRLDESNSYPDIAPGKWEEFDQRIAECEQDIREIMLQMYANPVLRK